MKKLAPKKPKTPRRGDLRATLLAIKKAFAKREAEWRWLSDSTGLDALAFHGADRIRADLERASRELAAGRELPAAYFADRAKTRLLFAQLAGNEIAAGRVLRTAERAAVAKQGRAKGARDIATRRRTGVTRRQQKVLDAISRAEAERTPPRDIRRRVTQETGEPPSYVSFVRRAKKRAG